MVSGNETRAGDGSRFAHLHFLSRQHELLVIFGGLLHNALHLLAQTAPHLQLCPLLVDAETYVGLYRMMGVILCGRLKTFNYRTAS